MTAVKPVIHGRDHRPGGADPIPVEAFSLLGVRYVIGNKASPGTTHTFNSTGPTIDGITTDIVSFDNWYSNDDGTIFTNGGGSLTVGSHTASTVNINVDGLVGVFVSTNWTAVASGFDTWGVIANVTTAVSGEMLNEEDSGAVSGRFWDNFAKTSPIDPAGGNVDICVRDQRIAYVNAPSQAYLSLRDEQPLGAGVGTNTF